MIRALLSERTVVEHGGRRFVCRPPSCRTVILALSYFSVQLLGARMAFRNNPRLFDNKGIGARAFLIMREMQEQWSRVAEVLATCCELHGGAPGELEELLAGTGGKDLALHLVEGVVSCCDMDRLIAAADLDPRVDELESDAPLPEASQEDDGAPLPMEIIVTRLAERFGRAPHEVMGWPYQEVIDLCESILPAIAKADRPRGPELYGMTADEWEEQGVTLTKGVTH